MRRSSSWSSTRSRATSRRRALSTHSKGALLAQPLGYANALAALAAIGVVLGTGLTALADVPQVRAATAATVPLLAATLPLTQSRGAVVALGAGFAVVVLCADEAAPYVRAALLVAPGAAAAAVAAALSRLSDGSGHRVHTLPGSSAS